jgi:hypothetical protein
MLFFLDAQQQQNVSCVYSAGTHKDKTYQQQRNGSTGIQ